MASTDNGSTAEATVGPSPATTPLGLSVGEAALRAGLSPRAVHHAIQSGLLPVLEVPGAGGRQYRIDPNDVDRFARARTPAPDTTTALPAGRVDAAARPTVTAGVRTSRVTVRRRLGVLLAALALVSLLAVLVGRGLGGDGSTPPRVIATVAGVRRVRVHTGVERRGRSRPTARMHGGGAGVRHASSGTGTTFTLITRAPSGGRVVIRGAMAFDGALTARMRAVLLDCPSARPSARAGTPANVATSGMTSVTTTLSLSVQTIERLQRWAAAYNKILNTDDPRVSGFVSDDEHENFERDGIKLWSDLHRLLGPSFQVVQFSVQRHDLLSNPSPRRCDP